MPSRLVKIVFRSLILLSFVRCAQVVPLSGGNKDEQPPKLLEATPALASTGFSTSVITLRFDEFIQVKNLQNELLVSPALEHDPEIEVDGKKVKIKLKKEELQPNTTYKIWLGKAVVDMHEGNALPDLEYVFSTGNSVDTLKLDGSIVNSQDNTPPGETVVGLYIKESISSDSFACKKRPDYVCRSTKEGAFQFKNLPSREFELVAFTDKNKNFTYEKDAEKVAFSSSPVRPGVDTNIHLKIFSELPSKQFIKRSAVIYNGKALVIYNKRTRFDVRSIGKVACDLYVDRGRTELDTLNIYFHTQSDSLHLAIEDMADHRIDSLHLALPKSRNSRFKQLDLSANLDAEKLERERELVLTSNFMLDEKRMDLKRVRLVIRKDSIRTVEAAQLEVTDALHLKLKNRISDATDYNLVFDTAAVFGQNGRYNDSLKIHFRMRPAAELGRLNLKMVYNLKMPYLVQLIENGTKVVEERNIELSLSSSNTQNIELSGVKPGTYSVKVVFDENKNGKWDTGDLMRKIQPEKVFISAKQIKVMSDWDAEEEIKVY